MKVLHTFAILASFMLVVACNNTSGEVSTADEEQPAVDLKTTGVSYVVSPGTSVMMWQGYKPGRTHTGTVDIDEGKIVIEGDQVLGGYLSINLTSIDVTDLEPGNGKEKLEAHLKGLDEGKENDFFNVTKYPRGSFELTKATKLENDEEANYMIYGNLKLKGISKNVGFRVHVDIDGNTVVVTSPLFKIDRTEWDLKFMSRNFFDNLGDNFIQDEIGLAVNLVAAANPG